MQTELIPAFLMAEHAHRALPLLPENAYRKWNKADIPYITHPVTVMLRTMDLPYYQPVVGMVALLHDTLEDTKLTADEIKNAFGAEVLKGVLGLTSYSKQISSKAKRSERKKMDLEHLLQQEAWVQGIKLCDVDDNLGDMEGAAKDFIAVYLDEKERQVQALRQAAPSVADPLLVRIDEMRKRL